MGNLNISNYEKELIETALEYSINRYDGEASLGDMADLLERIKQPSPEPEPLYAVLEEDVYQVAQDMNLPEGSITPEIVAKVREAYRNFDFSEHHQFIREQLQELGLIEQEEPAEKK